MFASHIANTCVFLFFYFGDSNSYAFISNRRVEFWHIEASMIDSFLFATVICYVVYASVKTGLVSLKAPADASHIISFPWQPTPLIIPISLGFSFI